MEPLTTFTDEEVLANDPPSCWVKITSSRCSKVAEEEAQGAMGTKAAADVGEPILGVPFKCPTSLDTPGPS